MSDNPDMPFSLYKWEAMAILDGARLKQLDDRRFLLEQAVNTANFQNAKKPAGVVKKAYRIIDKQSDAIIKGKRHGRARADHKKLKILEKVRAAFGGDS